MNDKDAYRAVIGFGEPLMSVRVGDSEVTLHRKERAGPHEYDSPLDSIHFRVVGPDSPLGSGGMVGRPWSGTVIGDQRVICGEMPTNAVRLEAATQTVESLPVHLGSGIWLVIAPRTQTTMIAFRNSKDRAVKSLRIEPWPAEPGPKELLAKAESEWISAPDYVAPTESELRETNDENAQNWDAEIKKYGLGNPLVTVPVRDQMASLYRQAHTGTIWLAITGIGGSFGPIDKYFSVGANYFGGWQVLYGTLAPNATSAEAVTALGEQIDVHLIPGAFIAVAPSAQSVKITFRNSQGRAVWNERFGAEGRQSVPSIWEMTLIYTRWLRLLIWRLCYGRNFWRQ